MIDEEPYRRKRTMMFQVEFPYLVQVPCPALAVQSFVSERAFCLWAAFTGMNAWIWWKYGFDAKGARTLNSVSFC